MNVSINLEKSSTYS